jgi:hypothetical protein
MISYNLMWNKSYLIFILNNYLYDNYLSSNRYNKLNNYRYDIYLNSNHYNELNVYEGHICNFLHYDHYRRILNNKDFISLYASLNWSSN